MCGVSTQTVSRVINNRPDVSAETRQAVEAAIARPDQPSAVAAARVAGRRRSGVVAGLGYFGVAQTLQHHREAQAAGYGVCQGDRARTPSTSGVIEFMVAHRVEGHHLRRAAARDERRQGPLAAAGGIAAHHLPEVRAVAGRLDDHDRQSRRSAAGHRAPPGTGPPPDRAHRRPARVERGPGPPRRLERDAPRGGLEPGQSSRQLVPGERRGEASNRCSAALRHHIEIFVGATRWRSASSRWRTLAASRSPTHIAIVGFGGLDGPPITPSLTTIVQPLYELGDSVSGDLAVANEAPGRGAVAA